MGDLGFFLMMLAMWPGIYFMKKQDDKNKLELKRFDLEKERLLKNDDANLSILKEENEILRKQNKDLENRMRNLEYIVLTTESELDKIELKEKVKI